MTAPRVVGGTGNPTLAEAVARELGTEAEKTRIARFPDGELQVVLDRSQKGEHVCIVQPTGPPVDQHVVELVLLVDACKRAGASCVTAVTPYFGYARQDRRSTPNEAIGAKAIARLIEVAGVNEILVVDPHSAGLETMFDVSVDTASAVPLLAAAMRPLVDENSVVVAPDLGAVKLAERYAAILGLPVAIVRKSRTSGERVQALDVVGDVRDRQPLIVDDMITTAATVEAAARALFDRSCRPQLLVAASHGVFVGPAAERLRALPVRHLVVSDSLPTTLDADVPHSVVGIHALLADAITGAPSRSRNSKA